MNMKLFWPLNLQLFAADGGGAAGSGNGSGGNESGGGNGASVEGAGTAGSGTGASGEGAGNAGNAGTTGDQSAGTSEQLERLIQARVDRLLAEERKKSAALQKKYDRLASEKLTEDELKDRTISEREATVAEKERQLTERENRLFAIKALKSAGLDDGSENVLALVDFVLAEDEKAIGERVTAFSALFQKMVAAEVEKTFKSNGREPNGAKGGDGEQADVSVAERIGKNAAAAAKQSSDILKHYLT